ncbi:MAG TPA: valine--tRNA ligase [Candidatus Acidoferrales bacterium]|jgi:valyl-tRNA synthetase|nr:valine--tRNA ligase [Candidatus Acidoferrales bacterium]
MTREIPKAYEPQQIEERWAQRWMETGLYRAEESADGPVFSIVIPPPNVTGYIHIGHMLEHTNIDILTRWHRMRGDRTLWLPGMDHAGISTQVVVEREIAKENLTRQQLGREEFERRVWEWRAKSGGTIKKQMIRLGDSCDWSRERFTLDPPLYRAVLEAFLRLYREGLIYRGRYIVNWCPRCMTALSDLEVVHEERQGSLWYLKYPVAGTKECLVVATTRPETMLGDSAVAVHPEDERYKNLIGKKMLLPLMNREIPIIADAAVDREFGTGAVKVTPAHDPNDFEMGRRHGLEEIDVMTEEAKMSANAGAYAGLDRFEARKRVVHDLEAAGLVERIENHTHSIGICDRCKTIVEPRLSTQWFLKMKPLAEKAVHVVESGEISIQPENQRKIFLDWMANIRDWCISRQLWWGHRIPIWHCKKCKAMIPARNSDVEIVDGHARAAGVPEKCDQCGNAGTGALEQDHDVLDTWFSSGLWPFSTLGWPDATDDLSRYYPTSLLISGYDILFFWDAKMIMLALQLTGQVPFSQLYLHSLVRDEHGQKMSKMRGNVIDPLEWMARHGTDALRFTLAIKAAPGTDISLSEDAVLGYRAFANKIWNAARFLYLNFEKFETGGDTLEDIASPESRASAPHDGGGGLPLVDLWIFSRLAAVSAKVNDALEEFRFHEAAYEVYHFFWGDFCDWYIEWSKPRLASADREAARAAWRNMFAVFEEALRLLHPFMPFITEELWHQLPQVAGARSISLAKFPERESTWFHEEADAGIVMLQEIISAARSLRSESKLDPRKRIPAEIFTTDSALKSLVQQENDAVCRLGALSELRISAAPFNTVDGRIHTTANFDLRLMQDDSPDNAADGATEIARIRKELPRLMASVESKKARLADEKFTGNAPAAVVEKERSAAAEAQAELEKLRKRLAQLDGGASGTARA